VEQAPTFDEPASTEQEGWTGFSAAWARGCREIFAIRLVRGRADPRLRVRGRPGTLIRWLGLSYGPCLLSLPLPLGAEAGRRAGLLLLLGTINAGMFAAASLAWGYVLRRADTVDELLGPCPRRDNVAALIQRAIDRRRQAALPAALGLLPWVVASFTNPSGLSDVAELGLMVNVTWTLFLFGNVGYWLIVPPLVVIRIRSWTSLAMRWNDPARTPGIRTLSEGYAYSALFLALAALAVTIPGLSGVPLFDPYLPYLYATLLGLSLWVGVVTQVVIYAMVRRFRLALLDRLAFDDGLVLTEDRASEVTNRNVPALSDTLTIYGSIAGAPGLPYGTALVVQYVAALVGSIVGFLLQ
jgi:hypothetical protein